MKRKMIMAATAIVIGCTACAQKIKEGDVPTPVKTAFAKKYPGIIAKWEKENGSYEVNFKKDGKTMSALYAANGTFMESEVDIKVSELPTTVISYVKEHYNGKAIKEGAKITKANGTVNYEAEVAGIDVLFDSSGKFIKEAKD